MGLQPNGFKMLFYKVFPLLLFSFVHGHQPYGHTRGHKQSRKAEVVQHAERIVADTSPGPLFGRQQTAPCSKENPCKNGCCNKSGNCGFTKAHCGPDVCVDTCQAKAECGENSAAGEEFCPLKVCCSPHGYCGTTSEFCGAGCQSNCLTPGATNLGKGDVQSLVIGYWGVWSLSNEGCGGRTIKDVPIDSLTHLNVAFGYMAPTTYEIYPIDGASEGDFRHLTNLKHEAPGLKVWLALGGWTYSDNGTTTQAVWGDLASSSFNRRRFILSVVKFMQEFGFDGLDLDWEYPGAPDRGGKKKEDTQNFLTLLREIRKYFDDNHLPYGLTITIPTSLWYLKWFPVLQAVEYVDWYNLMSYDLHGSWDSPESWIGSYVYGHTNITEIDESLNLLWRNNVPANQVVLGLGFYGRSYTLSDERCNKPGCPFSAPGFPGLCTQQQGVLSWDEIESIRSRLNLNVVYDKTTEIKYMTWAKKQWVSYDDPTTIKAKVNFANQRGLLGLMIWSIDLDDRDHTLLDAVLAPEGLGKFKEANGVGSRPTQEWTPGTDNQCDWSNCGEPCPGNMQAALRDAVQCYRDGTTKSQQLCCPPDATPDPASCRWSVGITGDKLKGWICSGSCDSTEILVATNDNFKVGNDEGACFFGTSAKYCCKAASTGADVCGFHDQCIKVDYTKGPEMPTTGRKQGAPIPEDANRACPAGRKFVTYKRGSCDEGEGLWQAYCCNNAVDTSKPICKWKGTYFGYCLDTDCDRGEVAIRDGSDHEGGGSYCQPSLDGVNLDMAMPLQLCCNQNALSATTKNLKVPIEWLFPSPGPSSNKNSFDLKLDPTYGGKVDASNNEVNNEDPDKNSFGLYVLSGACYQLTNLGPADQVTSMVKRDGSHWELYDCPSEKTEERQTVKAICTDKTEESNCQEIFLGEHGAPGTIVEMPNHCGPGKYAIAVSMEVAENQDKPPYLQKRGLSNATVYDFTFDYDYNPIMERASTDILMRLDYTDNPGYWKAIVDKAPDRKRHDIELEIQNEYGGSYLRYLEDQFRKEIRTTPHHKRDDLHKRWFSSDLRKWFQVHHDLDDLLRGVLRRSVNDKFRWYLFKDQVQCSIAGIPVAAKLEAYADVDINAQATAQVTLIGNLGALALGKLDQVAIRFRTKGEIKASVTLDARAKMHFTTGPVELFSAANFGAAFKIPGFVTIGPNLRVTGLLEGEATLHAKATAQMRVYSWDYAQKYGKGSSWSDIELPDVNDEVDEPETGNDGLDFNYDVDATGLITAHLTPILTLGIVFKSDKIADAAIDLGVDNYVNFNAKAGVGKMVDPHYCYSVGAGAEMFLRVTTPSIFGINFNRYHSLWKRSFWVIEETCGKITFPTPSFVDPNSSTGMRRRGLYLAEDVFSQPISYPMIAPPLVSF